MFPIQIVLRLVADCVDVSTGATPLLASAYLWNVPACAALLEADVAVDVVTREGLNVFHVAVSHSFVGKRTKLDFLATRTSDSMTGSGDFSCEPVLELLRKELRPEIVSALLRQRSANGQFPLHVAAAKYNCTFSMMKLLGACESDLAASQDAEGNTALHLACMRGNVELAHHLASPVSAKLLNIRGESPLLLALACVSRPPLFLSNMLLDGPHVSGRDVFAQTLGRGGDWAVLTRTLELASALACAREVLPHSDLVAKNRNGETAALLSLTHGMLEPVLLPPDLSEKGTIWSLLDAMTRFAAPAEDYAVYFAALKERKADLDARNSRGQNVLMVALERGNEALASALFSFCDLGSVDECGWTAMHYAARGNVMSVVRSLLASAHCDVPDTAGITPLRLAVRTGRTAAVKELVTKCAVTEAVKEDCLAAMGCSVNMADLRLARLVDVLPLFPFQQIALKELPDVPIPDGAPAIVFAPAARGSAPFNLVFTPASAKQPEALAFDGSLWATNLDHATELVANVTPQNAVRSIEAHLIVFKSLFAARKSVAQPRSEAPTLGPVDRAAPPAPLLFGATSPFTPLQMVWNP